MNRGPTETVEPAMSERRRGSVGDAWSDEETSRSVEDGQDKAQGDEIDWRKMSGSFGGMRHGRRCCRRGQS